MRILFMGTPDYALEILKSLCDSGEDVIGVVTQPDKPKGRGYKMIPPPVKVFAEGRGIPVFQPVTMKNEAFSEELHTLDPDMIIVAAYGKILPNYILDYPKYGCINAHGSILPKYRGAAPIQRAIMNGEKITGVTSMYMDDGIDTGDMILVERVEITQEDSFETLHDKLAAAGAVAMLKTIKAVKDGTMTRTKQCDADSTYAEKITKADRLIDFSEDARTVYDKIRGLSPFPKAFTYMPDGKMLQITKAKLSSEKPSDLGLIVSAGKDGFTVSCKDGCITVTEVVPEGKGKMSAAAFVNGRKIAVGDTLGNLGIENE